MTISLRLTQSQREAPDTHSFLFEPQPRVEFQAGQYLQLSLPHADHDDRGTSRSFTIASAPSEKLVRVTMRFAERSSSFKRALMGLAPGAVLEAKGPYGHFTYNSLDTPAVFIAGGIGITPFRSILADLSTRRDKPAVTLLYSNTTADIPFKDFLEGVQKDWPRLRVVYTVTRPTANWQGSVGRIDRELIARHVQHADEATYYICGPSPLVDGMRATLRQMGINDARIRDEGFPGYEAAREVSALAA